MKFDVSVAASATSETLAAIRRDAGTFASILGISIVGGVGYDITISHYPDLFLPCQLAFVAISLFLQAWATVTILDRAGVERHAPADWRIASLFGISLLFVFCVGIGLALLILPGVYLAARWYIAVPILLAEGTSVSEALGASWARTRDHWAGFAVIAVIVLVWQAGPLVANAFVAPTNQPLFLGSTVAANIVSQAGWLFGIAAAAILYLRFGRGASGTAEIFG